MKNNNYLIAIAIRSALALAIPSLAFAGDVEVQLPAAADAFTVDQPAGTELMWVNGDENVGIGTASPAKKLQVQGSILSQNSDGLGRFYGGVDSNKDLTLFAI